MLFQFQIDSEMIYTSMCIHISATLKVAHGFLFFFTSDLYCSHALLSRVHLSIYIYLYVMFFCSSEVYRWSLIWLLFNLLSLFQAFDVGEHDQKLVMAKELSSKVLKCVRDQFANHVIQKCIECLPPKDIHFILQSFCSRAKALSTHPYGCHVIQVCPLIFVSVSQCYLIWFNLKSHSVNYQKKKKTDSV